MSAVEWVLLGSLSLLWGGSFFFNRVLVVELQPFTVVWGRVALAALALLTVVRFSGYRMPRSWQAWGAFFAMGLLNNLIPFSLITWGQTEIASSLAAILNATTPLFTAVLAHALTRDERERLTARRMAGVLMGLIGVVLIVGPAALGGLGLNLLAQLAILGAALSYGFANIHGRRFRAMGIPPLVAATGQVCATAVMALPLVLFIDRPWALPAVPALQTWAALAGLAFLSTALAYLIFFRILAGAGAVNVALVTLLVPASALLLGAAVFGERLDARQIAGMATILAGLVVIDGRLPAAAAARLRGGRNRSASAQRCPD
ncbi:MAG: DMT family transporter [Pseudomonadota bacterium]